MWFADGTIDSGINQEGVDFYNKLINELIKNGSSSPSMHCNVLYMFFC